MRLRVHIRDALLQRRVIGEIALELHERGQELLPQSVSRQVIDELETNLDPAIEGLIRPLAVDRPVIVGDRIVALIFPGRDPRHDEVELTVGGIPRQELLEMILGFLKPAQIDQRERERQLISGVGADDPERRAVLRERGRFVPRPLEALPLLEMVLRPILALSAVSLGQKARADEKKDEREKRQGV